MHITNPMRKRSFCSLFPYERHKSTTLLHLHKTMKECEDLKSEGPHQLSLDQDSVKEKCCTCLYIENPYYLDDNKPNSAFILAINNFYRQGSALIEQLFAEKLGITGKSYIPKDERPPNCLGLTLDNDAVKKAEKERESRSTAKIESNIAARVLYDIGCLVLDELFVERPIARFWFLETVARIPYFSYVSMLHLYESFGWWRGHELL